jgi:hypothetical protein
MRCGRSAVGYDWHARRFGVLDVNECQLKAGCLLFIDFLFVIVERVGYLAQCLVRGLH